MIGGEFDLSAGVMIGSSGLLLGLLGTRAHLNIWPSIVLVLLFGRPSASLNGFAVVKTKLPSFIVTLGTFFILQGVNAGGTLKITGTVSIEDIDSTPGFRLGAPLFASTVWSPYDFKVKVIWWIGLTVVGAWLLARTRYGNWIYGVGGDPVAARNVGVPSRGRRSPLFIATSTTAALLGIIEALELRSHAGQRGRRPRVHLHHRGCRRRLPAHGRLRVGGRHELRCGDPRHGEHRDHPRRLGLELDLHVPGRDPRAGGDHERALPCPRPAGEVELSAAPHLLEADAVSKYYGNVVALKDISAHVNAGEVACILGDNGAGKSSFIKILSGAHQPDAGRLLVEGEEVHFTSPRDARARGIATVYQDLAMVPLMSIWRNFFLGAEPTKGFGPLQTLRHRHAKETVRRSCARWGSTCRDPDQPVGTLSGGERQSVAIARAVLFGARVLILDEPTSALGVKQAGVVLRYVLQARDRGVGGHLHHPQPASRLSGRRPLRDPEPRPDARLLREERDRPAGAGPADGRRRRAGGARARARADAIRASSRAVARALTWRGGEVPDPALG